MKGRCIKCKHFTKDIVEPSDIPLEEIEDWLEDVIGSCLQFGGGGAYIYDNDEPMEVCNEYPYDIHFEPRDEDIKEVKNRKAICTWCQTEIIITGNRISCPCCRKNYRVEIKD